MGVWFLSSALAHMLAGQIAKLTASQTVAGVVIIALDPGDQVGRGVFGITCRVEARDDGAGSVERRQRSPLVC